MVAAKYTLLIDEGSTFNQTFTLTDPVTGLPIPLTGYTAKAQIRKSFQDPTLLVALGINIDAAGGAITVSATAADTSNFAYPNTSEDQDCVLVGVWDLFITSPGAVVTRLLKGNVMLFPRVSQ